MIRRTRPSAVILLSLLLAACGWETGELEFHGPDGGGAPGAKADSVATENLEARVAFWESFAPICPDAGGFPSKQNCDDGDSVLFNGLLCAAGDARGCEAVRRSQDADGRWWRSPARIGHNRGHNNSFSRDMSMGVLLYLATAGDRIAAQRWIAWIESNRACSVRNPFTGGCTIRGPHRMCRDDTDQRCAITPNVWALMGKVWRYLGLSPTAEMRQFSGAYDQTADVQAANTRLGYPFHLVGVQTLLQQRIGDLTVTGALADRLARRQSGNPFFVYLRDGKTQAVIDRVVEVCPAPETGTDFPKFQWAWERDQRSEAWLESMGWDCLFMAALIRTHGKRFHPGRSVALDPWGWSPLRVRYLD